MLSQIHAAAWGVWELGDRVSFDGASRLITIAPEVAELDIRKDLYSAWVRWTALGNMQYLPAIRYTGLDPIPGGFTGDSYFLYNGWRLVIDLNRVRVLGVLFSDNYPTAYFNERLAPLYPATIAALVNTVTSSGSVVTGDLSSIVFPTATQNAVAVRSAIAAELARIDRSVSEVIAAIATPTPEENALAVRSALAAELARIDQSISSGAFGSSDRARLVAVPTAESNAAAVRQELAVEIARIDQSVSSGGLTDVERAKLNQSLTIPIFLALK